MFDVSTDLLTIVQARSRNLLWLYELYSPFYVPFSESSTISFDPRSAVKRFAGQSVSFTWEDDTIAYERQVIEGPSISKHKGKEFDTVSLQLSNVDRTVAAWVLSEKIQGLRLVIRVIPVNANDLSFVESTHSPFTHSIILFVGRVDKPDNFNRAIGTISATQDLGSLAARIPTRDYQQKCPLTSVFKQPGHDCMGNETMAEKSLSYQAAKSCNGSFAQCTEYDNTEFFQGIRIVQIQSSFVHKSHRGFWTKLLAIATLPISLLPPFRRTKTVVGNSTHDGTPYGQPISTILGRWQKKLVPLQFRDDGETIWGKYAACRGTIKDFLNITNESPNFSQPANIVKHLGEYGGTGTQTADAVFSDASFHSKLAYLTASFTGSNVKVEDPAPDMSSLIAGQVVRKAYGGAGGLIVGTGRIDNILAGYASGSDRWTDNPVDLVRYILTEPGILALPESFIAEKASARTSIYTTGAIKDVSNAERCLLPNTETARAGVDYKRYTSTGLIGPLNFFGTGLEFLNQSQKPGGVPDREAEYEFFDPNAPPASLDVKTVYRKRYTCNLEINETKKAVDLIWDTLLPCFRGFIRWDAHGRIAIDNERPADHSYLRADVAASATSIKVLDVTPWKPLEPLSGEPAPFRGKLLIGTHKLTSEVRPVTSASYSADGDAIAYSSSATGGLSAVSAGATLTGGSSSNPSTGTITISGTPSVGDTITAIIDGYTITIIATQEDVDASIPNLTLALQMIYAINAEPGLKEYIEANRGSAPGSSTDVTIISKFGSLGFTIALEEDHFAELDDPTNAPIALVSAGLLAAGSYLLAYAYRNTNGNTNYSPILSIELADNEQIDVDAITLPAGADSIDWFLSVEPDSGVLLLIANNDGSAFSINSLPDTTAADLPKRNTTGEECLRVMMSFAGKALTYADTTRANVLDGSFSWPEGGKQSTVNQTKGKYREAIQDFAERTLIINDERHQDQTGQTNTAEIDLSPVDNFNQASRLLNGYLAQLRDGDFFFKWGSAGEALLLEVGDVVCVSDDSGGWRNVPVRIEEPTYNQRFEITLGARLYSTSFYDDEVIQTDVSLPSDLPAYLAGPPAPTALSLAHVETANTFDSRITGTITLGAFRGQQALVYVTPPGGTEVVAQTLAPGETEFSVPAPASGDYDIRVVMVSLYNVPGGEISDTITVTNAAESLFTSSAYRTIQEEGVAVTQREILNFVGSSMTAADDAGNVRTNVTVQAYNRVQDEGSNLAQRDKVDFVGAGVTVTDDSGNAKTVVNIPGGSVSDGDKGDVVVSSSGATWTIDSDVVDNTKLANMAQATIKGRASGAGTGDPSDLTATQATAILDTFVGDSGAGGTKGLVPAPAAGDSAAGKFLKADGSFAVPPASTDTEAVQDIVGAMLSDGDVDFTYDDAGNVETNTVTQARGLRETSGPTTLAMGSVTNGQLLKRSGSSVVGVDAASIATYSGDAAYVMLPFDPPGGTPSTVAGTANNVQAFRFFLPFGLTVAKLSIHVGTLFSGGLCSVGIYSADGNTRHINSGTISTTTTGVKDVTLGAAVTLPSGFYWFAWTQDNGTSRFTGDGWNNTTIGALYNGASVFQVGLAVNTSTSGVLPTTLGGVTTTGTTTPIPICKLQG